ncbi:FHA domain-containing protein [Streptomyces sp. NPDC002845]
MMVRQDSLARGAPPAEAGTLHARSAAGEITVGPEPGRVVRFGRAEWPETDLCVGEDDRRVSRRHGELMYRHDGWWLRNTGQQPLRLPRDELVRPFTDPAPLALGYTPVFVRGFDYREHLIELYVTGGAPFAEYAPKAWPLSDDERLLLVVLGQRYLRHESEPRPLPHRKALQQLRFLRPDTDWESPGIEHRITEIGARLADSGGPSHHPLPTAADGGGPGTAVPLHHLLKDLVDSAHLVSPDLALLDSDLDG